MLSLYYSEINRFSNEIKRFSNAKAMPSYGFNPKPDIHGTKRQK